MRITYLVYGKTHEDRDQEDRQFGRAAAATRVDAAARSQARAATAHRGIARRWLPGAAVRS